MSSAGTFLSERTIGRQIRKVLKWLNVEGWGNDHAIKRNMGRRYCLLRKEVVSEI